MLMHLYCESYGEGQPLIILHGLFGSLDNWRTLSRIFARSLQVLALDQRNHGHSPHSDTFNYDVMAEDVHDFMLQHGLQSAALLGHSMGGKTAMQLAVNYPDMVDKLIVVDIAPRAYLPGHDDIFAALSSLEVSTLRTRQEANAILATSLPDETLRQFLLKNLEREAAGGFQWRIHLEGLRNNYEEILKEVAANSQFDKPTLVIRAGHSGYIQEEDIPDIKAIFPHAQLVTIPGVGHWLHAEAPQVFSKVVLDFLS
jgi:esterase